jgi:hypothetical protein
MGWPIMEGTDAVMPVPEVLETTSSLCISLLIDLDTYFL